MVESTLKRSIGFKSIWSVGRNHTNPEYGRELKDGRDDDELAEVEPGVDGGEDGRVEGHCRGGHVCQDQVGRHKESQPACDHGLYLRSLEWVVW